VSTFLYAYLPADWESLFLRRRMEEDASVATCAQNSRPAHHCRNAAPLAQGVQTCGSRKEWGPGCTVGVLGQSSTSEPIFLGLGLQNGVWHCREAAARLKWGNLAFLINRLLEPSPIGRNNRPHWQFCVHERNLRARPLSPKKPLPSLCCLTTSFLPLPDIPYPYLATPYWPASSLVCS